MSTVYLDGKRQRRVWEIDGVLQDLDTGEEVDRVLPQLRDYQLRAVVETRAAITKDCKKIILVSPTGSGKSWIISEIIRLAVGKGNTVLWLVHRRNLVYQMRDTLQQFGINPGVIMAGEESDTDQKVQVGTYQTYQRRIKFEDGRFFIDASLILIDECHRSLSKSYMEIMDLYQEKVVIGCTATPCRADNRPMGKLYDKIVDVISVKELTDNGFLAQAKYFAAPVDIDGVKLTKGDYDIKQLDQKVNTSKLVGDIVQNWLRIAQNRPTIVFCVTVKHSIHICEEFQKHGIAAMHLDAKSNDDERDEAFKKMESGEITVLCNVALYQEGMDCPNISCVVMARSTKSLGLYRQCLDYETEILTSRGFVGVDGIDKSDAVAAFDIISGDISFEEIISITDRPIFDGEKMYSFANPHCDIRVTGGHQIVFTGRRSIEGWKKTEASSLSQYKDGYRIPVAGEQNFPGVGISDTNIRFIGLFLTDGCLNKRINTITIYQSNHHIESVRYIDDVLGKSGFKYSRRIVKRKTQYNENGEMINWVISFGKPRGRDKNLKGWGELALFADKDISPILDDMDARQFKIFLESIVVGDGNKYKNTNVYWNPQTKTITSGRKIFTDRLQSMCVRRGMRCNVTRDDGNNCYRIHIKDQSFSVVGGSNQKDRGSLAETVVVSGERVWCVENRLGTIVTRRNGKVAIVGNCCGRGLRPKSGGFQDCQILDHGGVIEEHGLLTDEVEWTLEGKDKAWKDKKTKEKKPAVCKCPSCQQVFEGLKNCPDCGTELKSFGKKVEVIDAELQEISGKKNYSIADKRRFYGMLKHWVPQQKNPNPKRIAGAYKGKFKVWPRGMDDVAPIIPDMEFLNYMKSQAIRFAKSQPKRDYEPRNEFERLARTLPGMEL